jgi:hypothetical protein
MITPQEVKARAEKWWPEFLVAYLVGENVFPRDIPRIGKTGRAKTLKDFDRIRTEQQALLPGDHKLYQLYWREVNSRSLGSNRLVDRICVEDWQQYLRLVDKQGAFADFSGASAYLRDHFPKLEEWMRDNVLEVLRYADEWPNLMLVLEYFRDDHERDRHYIREVPVAVPTKFIETHKKVLGSLLDTVLPTEAIDDGHRGVKGFERRYGLKYRQPLVRLRLLDKDVAVNYFNGVNDLSLPLDAFAGLELPIRRVIILENKTNYTNLMNFLTLPQLAGTAGIFGSGFHAGSLKAAAWLHDVEMLYWGDLDAHGWQIVNQLRSHFPHLKTILMDRATLDALAEYQVEATPSTAMELPHLTAAELTLYDYLNDARVRLEQERVPVSMVLEALG